MSDWPLHTRTNVVHAFEKILAEIRNVSSRHCGFTRDGLKRVRWD